MTNYFAIKVFLHNKFAWLEFLEFLLRHQSNFEKKILSLNFYSGFFLPIIFHLFDIVICTRTYHKRSFFCLILNDNPMCVYFYVCVCVCVYVHPPWKLHLPGPGIRGGKSSMLCWGHFFLPPSLRNVLNTTLMIANLVWSTEPFLTSRFIQFTH